ncbi:MAG TPA: DNA methyltransferase, partial [Rhodocyclaceae bacterium]|nr:DNA methyltransferase [Rhodocyclaceae bacterium]
MSSNQSSLLSQSASKQLSIDCLISDPRNPRVHSPRQIKQIARSIQAFGFNVPILIDSQNKILCGHGRVLAAQQLGYTEVPTICLTHLTSAQARAFAIADNRLTENATWDDILLGEIFAELSTLELDFSLEDTGFTMGEIDLRIEGLASSSEHDRADTADALIDETDLPSVCQPGDVWQLGPHRIFCGNALEEASYQSLMQTSQAHLVFIDPPFNVPIQGHVSGHGKTRHREFAMASGEMSTEAFTQFLQQSFILLAAHSHAGSIHFVCMDWRHLSETLAAGHAVYDEFKNICVWVKDKGGMGSLYRSQHEMVLVFKHGTHPHRNNIELGRHGRYRTNVWNYPGANTLSRQGTEGDLLALHPTVKPVALIGDAILDCSARGEIVLDTFLGSGSTVLAAHRVGRLCYGMEID